MTQVDVLSLQVKAPTLYGGTCLDPWPAHCETTLYGSNTVNATTFDSYTCAGEVMDGPESHYRFESPIAGEVTVHNRHAERDECELGRAHESGAQKKREHDKRATDN